MQKTVHSKPLLACALPILLAACAESPTAAPPQTTASPHPPFPAIYNPEAQPHHLSLAQFHEIQSRATQAHPAHIWFVDKAENDGIPYRVSLYFVPRSHSGRISHGAFANFLSATRDELDFMQKTGMSTAAIDRYTYITDHATDDIPPPTESTFPFRTPERIPDADLLKSLDAAHAFFAAHKTAPLPVHNILLEPNGNVEIFFGWQTAPLSGGGFRLELQHHGGEFAVVNATHWVS
ncbi:MAG: hypothetical protein ACTHN5_09310 [Phycisphaerae bacterium]